MDGDIHGPRKPSPVPPNYLTGSFVDRCTIDCDCHSDHRMAGRTSFSFYRKRCCWHARLATFGHQFGLGLLLPLLLACPLGCFPLSLAHLLLQGKLTQLLMHLVCV